MGAVGKRVVIIAGGRAWLGRVVEERADELIVETDCHGRHAVRETYLDVEQAAKRFGKSMAAIRRIVTDYAVPTRRVRRHTYIEFEALSKLMKEATCLKRKKP